uniref:Uncharacterized protein n=1 Tax=Hymenopteran almendra-related virus OKIAV1 TaxID=2746366 RepID=A0A7D7F1D1_9RHAB|nr:hypothetical protein [Hymenopteran almendra-related virus OKIAV1]
MNKSAKSLFKGMAKKRKEANKSKELQVYKETKKFVNENFQLMEPSAPMEEPSGGEFNIELEFRIDLTMKDIQDMQDLISVLPNLKEEFVGTIFMWRLFSKLVNTAILSLGESSLIHETDNPIKASYSASRVVCFQSGNSKPSEKGKESYKQSFSWLTPNGGRFMIGGSVNYKTTLTEAPYLEEALHPDPRNFYEAYINRSPNKSKRL